MITRIEIDGFKSFADFSLDVPPFLLLVDANASGKSNLVDARRLSVNVRALGSAETRRHVGGRTVTVDGERGCPRRGADWWGWFREPSPGLIRRPCSTASGGTYASIDSARSPRTRPGSTN